MNRKILGLDIRNDAVSAVLVNIGIKGTTIEAHEHVPISNQKNSENGLAASLGTIAEKIDISDAICVASFPADLISYRNIKVPFKGQKKISKILPYELEPTLPFPVDDLIIDFRAIKRTDYPDHTDLITAAVEKSKLQSYLDSLSMVEIDPEIVTIGGYPAALCLNNMMDVTKKWLFIDIDKHRAAMFVAASGKICQIRSFPIQSDDIQYKAEALCTNIRRTLYALEDILDLDLQPDEVFITGFGLDNPDFENRLAKILELPVKRIDIVRDTDVIKQYPPTPSWVPHKNDNAFSLALMAVEGVDGLNFRKGPFAAKKFWAEHKQNLIKTGILAAVVTVIALSNVALDSYFMNKKLKFLNNQVTDVFTSTFPNVTKIVDPLHQMRTKMQEARKSTLLSGETDRNVRTIDILNNISKFIPKEIDVDFTRMVIGLDSVNISGNTDTFNSVDGIKSRLEQIEFFKKIVISSANIDKTDNRVRFKLKIDM